MGRWLSIMQNDGSKADFAELERRTPAGLETCEAAVFHDLDTNLYFYNIHARSPTHKSVRQGSIEAGEGEPSLFDSRPEARRSALRQCGRVFRRWK